MQVVYFEDISVKCHQTNGTVQLYSRSYDSFKHKLFLLRTSESIAITHMVLCNFIQEVMIVLTKVVSFQDI